MTTSTYLLDATLLCVVGEVDATTSAQLETALVQARRRGKPVIVDLSGVGFLDSGGLTVLLAAHMAAEREGSSLHLAELQPIPLRLLTITGVLSFLHVHTGLQHAVATVSAMVPKATAQARPQARIVPPA
ncbi:STAS domain-containing protein [Streptosporangium sp. NPDC001559]|uniref:STAS domain-containing protein n=1 Tax=Streptosporangium sp. NPDC001559 TaxID=3366187 RepID=UPI0036EAEBC0